MRIIGKIVLLPFAAALSLAVAVLGFSPLARKCGFVYHLPAVPDCRLFPAGG